MNNSTIEVYTDGSCNPKYMVGGWAAIILIDNQKTVLEGMELNTTHNAMELLSVIKAIECIEEKTLNNHQIIIYTDSQLVVRIPERKDRLVKNNFLTKKNRPVKNSELIKKIIHYTEKLNILLRKVKAHRKKTGEENLNRDVDRLSRKVVRLYVEKILNSKIQHTS